MNRIKINRINYYVLLSLLIHCFLFLLIKKDKDLTLGEKIIPIEIVDNFIETGFGEATKRSKTLIKRTAFKKEIQKEEAIKEPSDRQKSFEEKNKKLNEKKTEKKKIKNKSIDKTMLKEKKGSGSIKGMKNNEPEKGYLKGKGTIKVTCLKCVRPKYPPIALRRGAEGTPKVKVWINKSGKVYKAKLISVSGIKSIDRAAKNAAINSTFYPLKDETSINIEYDLKIR